MKPMLTMIMLLLCACQPLPTASRQCPPTLAKPGTELNYAGRQVVIYSVECNTRTGDNEYFFHYWDTEGYLITSWPTHLKDAQIRESLR